jgi:hypothetical protein
MSRAIEILLEEEGRVIAADAQKCMSSSAKIQR